MAKGSATQQQQRCKHYDEPDRCTYGTRCRFAHKHPSQNRSSHKPDFPRDSVAATPFTPDQARFRDWRFQIPKFRGTGHTLGTQLAPFFHTARKLVYESGTEIQQQVIQSLASEGGLERLNEAVSEISKKTSDQQKLQLGEAVVLPLLEIVSHNDVMESLILEQQAGVLYNFLYGVGGRRAVTLFSFMATFLASFKPSSDENASALVASLSVLHKVIELNSTAIVTDDFLPIIETLTALIDDDYPSALISGSLLDRIRLRMGLGTLLSSSNKSAPTRTTTKLPAFHLAHDLPGGLRHGGRRHDNDSEVITNIEIMPTSEEIESTQSEFLPVKDPSKLHLDGLDGLLDRQFRLLREDTVGQIRDAVRSEIHRLKNPSKQSESLRNCQDEMRVNLYHDVRLKDITYGDRTGLRALVSFNQPTVLRKKNEVQRKQWWDTSKNLLPDSLLCLISVTGPAGFFCVCEEALESNQKGKEVLLANRPRDFFEDPRKVTVPIRLIEPFELDIERIATSFLSSNSAEQIFCEFPNILLPSFYPTLKALQEMSKTKNLPFRNIICPSVDSPLDQTTVVPQYASRPDFVFDLKCLTHGHSLEFSPSKPFDFRRLGKYTSLDEAQQSAVINALNRNLALIQGPPGTGKSYTGVAFIKVLLDNAAKAKLGPIICVCYTNHALDQLLEHLVNDGITQIIRMGSRSKSELLEPLNIHQVTKNVEKTLVERSTFGKHRGALQDTTSEIAPLLRDLVKPGALSAVKAHLQRTNQPHYQQLFQNAADEEGFKTVNHDRRNPLEKWKHDKSQGHPSTNQDSGTLRHIVELHTASLWEMSPAERTYLYQSWQEAIKQRALRRLPSHLATAGDHKRGMAQCNQETNLRCLRQAKVVGVTTSGLARNLEVLRRLNSKVLLCEEAGEVLEAHLLTALLPSIEHAILIGDHEQLRPQVQNNRLSSENSYGEKYSLDVSLFERLIKPFDPERPALPFSSLEVQRRMHPNISRLVRETRYPDLKDHVSVTGHPEVEGMAKRLYWLTHAVPEAGSEEENATSRSNDHEVELVAALVTHLVRQGKYNSEDIAIITPYLGQFAKIRRKLAMSFEIVVGEKDEDELAHKGLGDSQEPPTKESLVQKSRLDKALRMATVDNFQGEEAKVIVVSLVRSNVERKPGFLKTSNRINVLLSRAQHGMYIIGDAENFKHVHVWDQVIDMFAQTDSIGPSLALCCPRHPKTAIEVSTADDFAVKAPEGGCDLMCEWRLACGHKCINKCHSAPLHQNVVCLEPCPRSLPGCEHACPMKCGYKCAHCKVKIENVELPCGHIEQHLACFLAQDTSHAVCNQLVERQVSGCNHTVQVACHEADLRADFRCRARCDELLPCGHPCLKQCYQCNEKHDGSIIRTEHDACRTKCGRLYICGHQCQANCHEDEPCPLCQNQCKVRCPHSRCNKACCEPCAPCAEPCTWACPHQGQCSLPCAAPCNLLPCSEACTQLLDCDHECPSICGESCPSSRFCQKCCSEEVAEVVVDWEEFRTYGEIDLTNDRIMVPSCGHPMTITNMDQHLGFEDHYEISEEGVVTGLKGHSRPFSLEELKNCPTCREPLRNLNRYNRIVRRGFIDEATKKFITWSNATFVPLAGKLQDVEKSLAESQKSTTDKSGAVPSHEQQRPTAAAKLQGQRNEIIACVRRMKQLTTRYKSIMALRREIIRFLAQVAEDEQPFGRIYELVQNQQRRGGKVLANFDYESTIVQTRCRLLATSLSIRCDLTIITDALTHEKERTGPAARYVPSFPLRVHFIPEARRTQRCHERHE